MATLTDLTLTPIELENLLEFDGGAAASFPYRGEGNDGRSLIKMGLLETCHGAHCRITWMGTQVVDAIGEYLKCRGLATRRPMSGAYGGVRTNDSGIEMWHWVFGVSSGNLSVSFPTGDDNGSARVRSAKDVTVKILAESAGRVPSRESWD